MFHVLSCDSPIRKPCPMLWRRLERTNSETIRSCGTCNRLVHLCTSARDLDFHVAAGNCVALWVADPQSDLSLTIGKPGAPYG